MRIAPIAAGLLLIGCTTGAWAARRMTPHRFDFCQVAQLDDEGFISADEREGFELMLEVVDDTTDIREFTAEMKDLDDDQQKVVDYLDYVEETCTQE